MLMALKQVLLESVFIFLQCVVWMLVVFISSLITPCVDFPVSSVSGAHRDPRGSTFTPVYTLQSAKDKVIRRASGRRSI